MEISDQEAWARIKQDDIVALQVIYERHYFSLFQYALKFCGYIEMAEDHLQSLFLKIWERRHLLGYVSAVKTYLWAALRNSLMNSLKRKQRELNQLDNEVNGNKEIDFNVEEIIIHEETAEQRRRKVNEAYNELPGRQKEILLLKFYEGMNYEEIEKIMSINSQTARNYVYKGLETIRKTLAEGEIGGRQTIFK